MDDDEAAGCGCLGCLVLGPLFIAFWIVVVGAAIWLVKCMFGC
jgi:hypothetical protein